MATQNNDIFGHWILSLANSPAKISNCSERLQDTKILGSQLADPLF